MAAVTRRTPGMAQRWIDDNNDLPPNVSKSIEAYETVERMMEDANESELDAVYVATPPGAHLENVRQIVTSSPAGSGETKHPIRAVYVEKPCGRCAWETRAMVDECRAKNVEFYPAYVSRSHERTRALRELLGEDKVCGDSVTRIRYTQRGSGLARGLDAESGGDGDGKIPWRLNAEAGGGGLIMDMGCHVLDRLDYLFGPLGNVESTVLRKGGANAGSSSSYPLVEDYVRMSATISECDWSAVRSVGARVECVWDFSPSAGDDVDELIISGPGGSVRMAAMGAGLPIRILDAEGNLVRTVEFDAPAHAAQPLIQSVVDELSGGDSGEGGGDGSRARSPARADNAVRTSEVLDSVLGSYYGGRHDEFWKRPDTWPGLKVQS